MTEVTKSTGVGHIPSGLFIITAHDKDADRIDGFLGSWVQQVSFDPLLVSLAIKPGRPCSDHILKKGRFTINVVGDHDKTFLKHFWSGYDPEKNPFAEIEHSIGSEGEVFIKGARSTIVAEPIEVLEPGDHNLIIAKVIDSAVHSDEAKSMVHQRKDGLSY